MKKYLKNVYAKDKKSYFKKIEKSIINNEKLFIVTENPETVMTALKDDLVSDILLDKSVSIVPDGIAIIKACRMLHIPVTERITGIDIATFLLEECNKKSKSLYLYGAKKEVVDTLVKKIIKDYPNIKVLGHTDGYVADSNKVFDKIAKLKPDVCLVALGIPKQEKLIYQNLDRFNKGIFIGVGGSFDVLSGTKKRAPKIFVKLNLEWLYRIVSEPKRLKRFWNNNVKFIFKVLKSTNK